jgi:hypothetical protein
MSRGFDFFKVRNVLIFSTGGKTGVYNWREYLAGKSERKISKEN